MNERELIRTILKNTKTIAVIGLSDKPERSSYGVAQRMQEVGFRVIPINPAVSEILGEKSYPSLADADRAVGQIDLVDVFRAPEFVPAIVDEVLRLKIPYLWLQQGVRHDESARRAEAGGVKMVSDRCIAVEYAWMEAAEAAP